MTCRIRITELAVQWPPQMAATPLRRDHPGAVEPRGSMAYVLLVPTFQISNPVLDLILMIADDLALHRCL